MAGLVRRFSGRCEGVDLVEEDDGRCLLAGTVEGVLQAAFGLDEPAIAEVDEGLERFGREGLLA